MSRTEDVLTLFLASPGDVVDERNRFEETVNEWNRAWSRNFGLRLEVLRWENDAYPAIGEDAQDVINKQIPGDYDIFVGMMWSRFGTPTGRAGSGTAEEFALALSRHRSSPNNVEILFYFKDTAIPPSKLDPAQLVNVNAFKQSLAAAGVFYWEFSDTDQFEKLIGLHLAKHVQNWLARRANRRSDNSSVTRVIHKPSVAPSHGGQHLTEEDLGYLDFLETFLERSAEVAEIASRMTIAQQELTTRMAQRTEELNALIASPHSATPAQAKRLIAKAADDMLQFTNRLDAEIPLFRAAIDGSIGALTNAATISMDMGGAQTEESKTAAEGLLTALCGARESMSGFRASTAALPRMTKDLNAAKRQQLAALDALIGEFQNGERLLVEAIAVIEALLAGSSSAQ